MPTTSWTIFGRARSSDPETARRAVDELCAHYLDPIYGHFRDRGEPHERAEDLVQGLLLELIATGAFARMDPKNGSARAYLRKAADRFAKDQRVARTSDKRGGGVPDLVLDTTDARERYSPADPGISPERAWDMRWAHNVLEAVFDRIHADLVNDGKADRWEWLEPLLREEARPGLFAELAERLGKREGALRTWVWRMRKRAEDYVRQELADQVLDEDEAELDAERERLRESGLKIPTEPSAHAVPGKTARNRP